MAEQMKEFETTTKFSPDTDEKEMMKRRSLDEMFDGDFKDFSHYLRSSYGKKYTFPVMRKINRNAVVTMVFSFSVSLITYAFLRNYFHDYVYIWWVPFFLFNLLWVIQKEEIVHMRAHWSGNMTDNASLDKVVDWTMIALTGASKETFRRRHLAAHYADIGNFARIFSDVWLPFITLPPLFYVQPWNIIKMALDAEWCKKEKMDRTQLLIEALGLNLYLCALFAELYFGSYWILCFHMIPLLLFHSSQFLSAMISHSGIDKRNSFNSNGLFDEDTIESPMFRLSAKIINRVGNFGFHNHGIHHAFSQLPLEVINHDYKIMNAYALKNYKNVRYNTVISHIIHANILDRLTEPKWYHFIIQALFACLMLLTTVLTILGLPVPPPVVFELLLVDYRAYFYTAERFANTVAMWNALELHDRKKELINPNAYCILVAKRHDYMMNYLKNYPDVKIPSYENVLACPECMHFNVKQRGKAYEKSTLSKEDVKASVVTMT